MMTIAECLRRGLALAGKTGVAVVAIATTAWVPGCGSNSSQQKEAAGRLDASNFAVLPGEASVPLVERAAPSGANGGSTPRLTSPSLNDAGTLDVAAVVGTPSGAAPTPQASSDNPLVLDSLVGQINGNPVYASKFFRDTKLDSALAGMLLKLKDDSAWRTEARKAIRRALIDKIRDELVLAEARSSLTPEERKGLLFFLDRLRNELISGSGGSEAVVDESLREREGKNLDEKVKEDLETKLVQREIYQRVASKVIVSWKDVQLEYERRFAEFNPPPMATLRMIWLPGDKQELIDEFKKELAAGTPIKTLAARSENQFNSGEAGLVERTLKGGVYADTEFFPRKELNDAALTLTPGAMVGPVAYERRVAWIALESIQTPTPKTLYDVQLQLDREIKERRFKEESEKYLAGLMNKGSFSDLDEMSEKLLAIANDRYIVAK